MPIGDEPPPPGATVIEGPRGGRYVIPRGTQPEADDLFDPPRPDAPEEERKPTFDEWFDAGGAEVVQNPNSLDNLGPPGEPLSREDLIGRFGKVVWYEGEPVLLYNVEDRPRGDLWVIYRLKPNAAIEGVPGDDGEVPDFREPPEDFVEPDDVWAWVDQTDVAAFANTLLQFHTSIGAVPPSIDLTGVQAENIKSLQDYGVRGGVNKHATRIVQMQDGRTIFAKQYDDQTYGSGEVAAIAAGILAEMGVHAPNAAWEPETDLFVAAAVENSRAIHDVPMGERDDLVQPETALRAYLGGIILGNNDMHQRNLVVDDDGVVHLIDNDLSGSADLFDDSRGGYPNNVAAVDIVISQYARTAGWPDGLHFPDREEFNALAREVANGVSDSLLDTVGRGTGGTPAGDRKHTMVENIRAAREQDMWPEGYVLIVDREDGYTDVRSEADLPEDEEGWEFYR